MKYYHKEEILLKKKDKYIVIFPNYLIVEVRNSELQLPRATIRIPYC